MCAHTCTRVYRSGGCRRGARWGDLLTQFVENMTQPRLAPSRYVHCASSPLLSARVSLPLSSTRRSSRSLFSPLVLALAVIISFSIYLFFLRTLFLSHLARFVFLCRCECVFFSPLPLCVPCYFVQAHVLYLRRGKPRCLSFSLSLSLSARFLLPLAAPRSLSLSLFLACPPPPILPFSRTQLIYSLTDSRTLSRTSDRASVLPRAYVRTTHTHTHTHTYIRARVHTRMHALRSIANVLSSSLSSHRAHQVSRLKVRCVFIRRLILEFAQNHSRIRCRRKEKKKENLWENVAFDSIREYVITW